MHMIATKSPKFPGNVENRVNWTKQLHRAQSVDTFYWHKLLSNTLADWKIFALKWSICNEKGVLNSVETKRRRKNTHKKTVCRKRERADFAEEEKNSNSTQTTNTLDSQRGATTFSAIDLFIPSQGTFIRSWATALHKNAITNQNLLHFITNDLRSARYRFILFIPFISQCEQLNCLVSMNFSVNWRRWHLTMQFYLGNWCDHIWIDEKWQRKRNVKSNVFDDWETIWRWFAIAYIAFSDICVVAASCMCILLD